MVGKLHTKLLWTKCRAWLDNPGVLKKFHKLEKRLLNEEIDVILFEDEAMIRDYQAIGKTWFQKGKQKIIPTYGKHQGVKLLGTLDYVSGKIFCVEDEKYDAKVYLSFLEKVLAQYPDKKMP